MLFPEGCGIFFIPDCLITYCCKMKGIFLLLEFEKPVVEIEEKIAELTSLGDSSEAGIGDEVKALEKKAKELESKSSEQEKLASEQESKEKELEELAKEQEEKLKADPSKAAKPAAPGPKAPPRIPRKVSCGSTA